MAFNDQRDELVDRRVEGFRLAWIGVSVLFSLTCVVVIGANLSLHKSRYQFLPIIVLISFLYFITVHVTKSLARKLAHVEVLLHMYDL
uniref:Uncharacterized protein n=1 Tax=viral metagenome TaxID=1070528 RepID=A0A6C0K8L0_9ZZZZ